jgi:hypothetical protein
MTPFIIFIICIALAFGIQLYLKKDQILPGNSDDWTRELFLLIFILGAPVTAIVVLIQRYL